MRQIQYVSFIFICLFIHLHVYADSPLTSTNICGAYSNHEIIQKASTTNGKLTIHLMSYLADSKNPIDVKIAMINQLGWDPKGKNNATLFFRYLKKRFHYKSRQDFLASSDCDAIICMAYLKALDDYFNVDEAHKFAIVARSKSSSYTVHMVHALIAAQKELYKNWCQVYHLTYGVQTNQSLKVDMRQQAIQNIFSYMNSYKKACRNPDK